MYEKFMLRAIELAKLGQGFTNPNPLVGAVIVKDGVIIGEGFHQKYGQLHAEREALLDCRNRGHSAKGACIYVTMEPCSHYGRQPPCTQALIEAGIDSVVVGSQDPNPLVCGKGNEILRKNGITVVENFMKEECDSLNEIFFHYITSKTPYVALKYAMTMDGKIATRTGKSKWITGEKSRNYVHILRNKYSAILVGIGTVLADDPMLDCRLQNTSFCGECSNPLRIILDSSLSIPVESKIVQSARKIETMVVCRHESYADSENLLYSEKLKKKSVLEQFGVEVLEISEDKKNPPYLDLAYLMSILYERKIDSVLIEGGAKINYSALQAGIVNKVYCFMAPKIFGSNSSTAISGFGVEDPQDAFKFKLVKSQIFDEDILLEYCKK